MNIVLYATVYGLVLGLGKFSTIEECEAVKHAAEIRTRAMAQEHIITDFECRPYERNDLDPVIPTVIPPLERST